jgi:hypothetical protein
MISLMRHAFPSRGPALSRRRAAGFCRQQDAPYSRKVHVTTAKSAVPARAGTAAGIRPLGFGWYWMLPASDDVGTKYGSGNLGAFDGTGGRAATRGYSDIGGQSRRTPAG